MNNIKLNTPYTPQTLDIIPACPPAVRKLIFVICKMMMILMMMSMMMSMMTMMMIPEKAGVYGGMSSHRAIGEVVDCPELNITKHRYQHQD